MKLCKSVKIKLTFEFVLFVCYCRYYVASPPDEFALRWANFQRIYECTTWEKFVNLNFPI